MRGMNFEAQGVWRIVLMYARVLFNLDMKYLHSPAAVAGGPPPRGGGGGVGGGSFANGANICRGSFLCAW